MNTAVLVTCIRNFRRNRGPVSGILKGYVGLSTAIFTNLCSALVADDPAFFLLTLALVPFIVCLTGVFFLREVPVAKVTTVAEDNEEGKYFGICNAVAVVLAVYLLAYGFVPNANTLVSRVFVAVLLVLLASPLGIPVYAYFKGRNSGRVGGDVEGQRVTEPLIQNREVTDAMVAETEVVVVKGQPAIGEEHTIMEVMKSLDFWILFVSFLCGVGTGLAVMNNMGQIGLALGYTDVSIFVSLTSIFGFFGRIVSGSVSEHFIK
jgi:hypothetical protein